LNNIIAAQRHKQNLLSNIQYKDARLQTGIKNIAEACECLIRNKKTLNYAEVGEYCFKNFKMAKRTVTQDSKGIYKPLIDQYLRCLGKLKEEDIPESNKIMGHKELLIYSKHLEKKYQMLKKQLKIAEDHFCSTNVFDLAETLSQPTNYDGGVKPVTSAELTKEQKMALSRLLGAEEIKFQQHGNKTIAFDESGEIILQANEYKLLDDLIK